MADYDKAYTDFTNAIALDDKLKPYALNNRGNAKRLLKNYTSALEDINESIKSDSANAWAYLNKGLIYYDQNLYEKALVEFNKSIRYNSLLPNAYFHRANVFMMQKQYDKAVIDFNKIQELDADFKSMEIEKNRKIAIKNLVDN
jgi:tetratricopeptide (TPR) repeat protein